MRDKAVSYLLGVACGLLLGLIVTSAGVVLIGRSIRSAFDNQVIQLNERIASGEKDPGRMAWVGPSLRGDGAER